MAETPLVDSSPGKRAGIALAAVAVLCVVVGALAGPQAYNWLKAVHVIAVISWMGSPRPTVDALVGNVEACGREATYPVIEHANHRIHLRPPDAWRDG